MYKLGHEAAVESIVVGGDAGSCDEDRDSGVVHADEYSIYVLRVVAEEVEQGRAGETHHGPEEEAKQHGLLSRWQLVYLNVLKQESDVVAVDIDPEAEHDEEYEPQEVGPDVPRLRVHAKHALEAAREGVHRRSVCVRQEGVVLQPVREVVKWQ